MIALIYEDCWEPDKVAMVKCDDLITIISLGQELLPHNFPQSFLQE